MARPKEEWLQAIATRAEAEISAVEGILSAHRIQPSPVLAQPRRLVLREIEFSGEKDGVANAGAFAFSWTALDHGLWAMLSEQNLRGKSTIIEVVRWMIRGRPSSNLQDDVRRWLHAVRLSFLLDSDEYEIVAKTQGEPIGSLYRIRSPDTPGGEPGKTVLADFATDGEFEAVMADFFMRMFAMDPISTWRQGKEDDGQSVTHSWVLDFFLGLAPGDDTEFLRRAAKIVGVAFSHWRDKELVEVLRKLAQLEAVRPEAAFELGMAALAEAMDRADSNVAATAFREARDWFGESDGVSEHRPEASLYLDGLDLLLGFHSGATSASLGTVSARVQQHAFELHAWSGGSGPPWLGARQTEAACWSALASAIAGLAGSLDEPSWWKPAAVIEEGLLSVYSAGRSILRRDQHSASNELV